MKHEHEFIVVGPYCWGKGKTEKEAIKNMRIEWNIQYAGKYSLKKCNTWMVPVGSWVSAMDGSIHLPNGVPRCPACGKVKGKSE